MDPTKNDTNDFGFVRRTLDRAAPGWQPSTSCVFAFEASPTWSDQLKKLAVTLRPRVSALHLNLETAILADRRQQAVTLHLDKQSVNGVGSSVLGGGHTASRSAVRVRAINLADWLQTTLIARGYRNVPLVIRMDVEGEEYATLKDLVVSGVPRQLTAHGITTSLAIEWHRFAKDRALGDTQIRYMNKLDQAFVWAAPIAGGMLDKQFEKVLTYMLSTVNISTHVRYFSFATRKGLSRGYFKIDQQASASFSDAEFASAFEHGRRRRL